MSRVLVTGASGFLGRRLVAVLQRSGHAVVAAVRDPASFASHAVQVVRLDVADRASIAALPTEVDLINHAAARRLNPDEGWQGIAALMEINASGTLNLLEFAEAHGIRRVVYCSSLSVYTLPRSLLAQWVRQVRQGQELVVYGNGERSLDFLYLDDAVDAIGRAVEREQAEGIVNLGSGREVTWRELAEQMVDVFSPAGARVPIRLVAQGSRTRCCLAIERARQVLGFEPRVSLREGL